MRTAEGIEIGAACGRRLEPGELEAGQRADMITVEANPIADVTRLENVLFVMKNGGVYKPR